MTPIQMVLMVWVVAGREALDAGISALLNGLAVLGAESLTPAAALLVVLGSSAAAGGLVGWWAWDVAARVDERLAR